MALGDGPVRRVLSLRGGRYFRVSVFLTSLLPRTSHKPVEFTAWFTGAPSTRVRAGEAAEGAARGPIGCGMRMARGAGSASGCEPRATGDPSAARPTSIEYVTASGVRPRIESTKDDAMICLKFRFHWLAFGATRRGRRPRLAAPCLVCRVVISSQQERRR